MAPTLPEGGAPPVMLGATGAGALQFEVLMAMVLAPRVTVAPGQFAPFTDTVCACTGPDKLTAIMAEKSTDRSFWKFMCFFFMARSSYAD